MARKQTGRIFLPAWSVFPALFHIWDKTLLDHLKYSRNLDTFFPYSFSFVKYSVPIILLPLFLTSLSPNSDNSVPFSHFLFDMPPETDYHRRKISRNRIRKLIGFGIRFKRTGCQRLSPTHDHDRVCSISLEISKTLRPVSFTFPGVCTARSISRVFLRIHPLFTGLFR